MEKKSKGIVHNAFYKPNKRGNTKETFWGRSQSTLMEMFKYGKGEDGKISIAERKE